MKVERFQNYQTPRIIASSIEYRHPSAVVTCMVTEFLLFWVISKRPLCTEFSNTCWGFMLWHQARSQEFAMRGRLFWRMETISNDLDPDFDRSSLRLSRFFCPNGGDLRKKKEGLQPDWSPISPVEFTSGPWSILFVNSNGWLFSFLVQKSATTVLKTGYFAYSLGQWGRL